MVAPHWPGCPAAPTRLSGGAGAGRTSLVGGDVRRRNSRRSARSRRRPRTRPSRVSGSVTDSAREIDGGRDCLTDAERERSAAGEEAPERRHERRSQRVAGSEVHRARHGRVRFSRSPTLLRPTCRSCCCGSRPRDQRQEQPDRANGENRARYPGQRCAEELALDEHGTRCRWTRPSSSSRAASSRRRRGPFPTWRSPRR